MHDHRTPTRTDNRLPKSARLLTTADFRKVFRRNRTVSNNLFRVLVHCDKYDSHARLGVVVSRQAAKKAVRRNRIKRQVRETFRVNQAMFQNMNVIVIAGKDCDGVSNQQLRTSLLNLFRAVIKKCAKS